MTNKIQDLLAKYEFWRARTFIKLGKHYTVMYDVAQNDGIAIKLLKKYPGVIIEYSEIVIGGGSQMNFNVQLIANPNLYNVETKAFNNYTTAVFRSILYSAIKNMEEGLNENRNIDTFESDSERVFHEEESPVPEERVSNRKPRKKTVRRNKAVRPEVQQSPADSSVGDQSQRVD